MLAKGGQATLTSETKFEAGHALVILVEGLFRDIILTTQPPTHTVNGGNQELWRVTRK